MYTPSTLSVSSPSFPPSLPPFTSSTESPADLHLQKLIEHNDNLPEDVVRLVMDASCNISEAGIMWGNLEKPSSANCTSDILNFTESCTDTKVPKGASIAYPIILFTLGIVGQIWALIYLYRTPRNNSRTVVYVMLSNLLWTDLLGKVLTTPPAVMAYISGHWVGGKNLCLYHGYVMSLIGMVTHLMVCAMAVERLLGIRHGYFYNQNVTTYRVKFFLKSIWCGCVLFCSLPLFGVSSFNLQFPGSWCFIDFHPCSDTPTYMLLYSYIYGTINIVCLMVMVICNIVVVGTLLKMRLSYAMPSMQAWDKTHRSRKHSELEIQMVFVLLVITTVFVVSWGPLDTLILANGIWPHVNQSDHWIDFLAIRLVSLNQIVNPWAYIICRVAYRSKMCLCCRQNLLGRKFSLLDDGKRSSLVNSLRSIRKLSKSFKDASPYIIKRENSSDNHNESSLADPQKDVHMREIDKHADTLRKNSNRDSGNSSTCTPILKEKSPEMNLNGEFNSNVLTRRDLEMVTYALPASMMIETQFSNSDAESGDKMLHSESANLCPGSYSPHQRRIGIGNLLLHPLARVVSNRSFKKLKEDEDLHHKRAHSLDSGTDGLLLVVPITARCRSDHLMRENETEPKKIEKTTEDSNRTKSSNEIIPQIDSGDSLLSSAPSVVKDGTNFQKIEDEEPATDNDKFRSSIEIKLFKD